MLHYYNYCNIHNYPIYETFPAAMGRGYEVIDGGAPQVLNKPPLSHSWSLPTINKIGTYNSYHMH